MRKKILIIVAILVVLLVISVQFAVRYYVPQTPDALSQREIHQFSGKVIIVGAGAAGLSAANFLQNNSVDYKILEATDRYGGRIQKNTNFADFPIDIGAEWIHDDKAVLNRLRGEESDNVAEQVVLYQPMNVYTWDGENYDKTAELLLKIAYSAFKEYKFKRSTWFDFIETNFANNVKHNIIYNSPVTEIDYTANSVKITTQSGQTYTADKVIVTVPLGVLQGNHITFNPAMPDEKIKAIQSVYYPPGFKLFMKFSEQFYPDMIAVETEKGEKSYYDVAYHKGSTDNVLGLLSVGTSAEKYQALGSEEEMVKAVLDELDTIFNGKASQTYLGEHLLQNWSKEAYILGAYTDSFTDDEELLQWLNAPLANKVYFAGETYAEGYRSTVHGAIISGNQTAMQILSE